MGPRNHDIGVGKHEVKDTRQRYELLQYLVAVQYGYEKSGGARLCRTSLTRIRRVGHVPSRTCLVQCARILQVYLAAQIVGDYSSTMAVAEPTALPRRLYHTAGARGSVAAI